MTYSASSMLRQATTPACSLLNPSAEQHAECAIWNHILIVSHTLHQPAKSHALLELVSPQTMKRQLTLDPVKPHMHELHADDPHMKWTHHACSPKTYVISGNTTHDSVHI
jgi:hypothetical protein